MEKKKLEELRLLTLGDSLDSSRDELLTLLYMQAEARLRDVITHIQKSYNMQPDNDIPSNFKWIIDEITIKRFNRLGSEGFSSESINGHSVNFDSDDFADYREEIAAFYKPPDEGAKWVVY